MPGRHFNVYNARETLQCSNVCQGDILMYIMPGRHCNVVMPGRHFNIYIARDTM